YSESCDWSQLVTWYKAVVNSIVPCDLCDHSQISLVVSNDVRSDILLTTIHVITDWPISDHMIGTSHRGPVKRLVLCCVQRTQQAPDRGAACACSQGARTDCKCGRCLWQPAHALLLSGRLCTWAGREVV
ncbi:unnamed protein product, partial [Staurois parvus]